MEIASNFDAKLLTSIARDSESKQAVKDVSYASYITYKSKAKLYCEHTDNSFIIGTLCKKYFRIIGMATRSSHKHQGLAKKLLNRALQIAKKNGIVTYAEICKDIQTMHQYEWRRAQGFNCNTSEKKSSLLRNDDGAVFALAME